MTLLASVQTAADSAPLDVWTVLLVIGALALLVLAVGGLARFIPPAPDDVEPTVPRQLTAHNTNPRQETTTR